MKRFLLPLLLVLFLFPLAAKATHITGEEIYYKNTAPGVYKIYLALYGTCQGQGYAELFTGTPYIAVIDSIAGTVYTTIALARDGDSVNVSPYCPRIQDTVRTNCDDPASVWQGVVRYVYSGTVTLPGKSNKWAFMFTSATGNNCSALAVRNSTTNTINPPNDNISIYATLNNNVGDNSSPQYTSTPKYNGFYCPGQPSVYTQSSTDPDSDSLYYSFVQPYYNAGNCITRIALNFVAPYSIGTPLLSVQTFHHNTGEIDFTPNAAGDNNLVSVRIAEYRHGVLIGTSMREKIFITDNKYCGLQAAGHVDTLVTNVLGATVVGQDSLYICPGNTVIFQLPVTDPAGDTTTVSFTDVLEGSTVSVNDNTTSRPVIRFVWNTDGVPYGVYTFTANFSTKSCPLPRLSSNTYTFIVGDAGDITYSVLSETDCIHKAAMQFQVANGNKAYSITLLHAGDTVRRYNLPAGTATVNDSLPAGTYQAVLLSQGRPCTSYINVDIYDSGPFPYKPVKGNDTTEYCRNFKDSALVAHLDSNASYLKWYDGSNNPIPGPVVPSTAYAGTYLYTVSQVFKTCESARDTMIVIIDPAECDYDVNIHNAITPNGDGKNDVWEIEHLNFYPQVHVQVFDKLGDKVFDQEHYGAPWWDGGKLPSGVYYYVVDLGKPNIATGIQKYTGYILIKR